MVSLKRFFQSLAVASKDIKIEAVKPEPSLKLRKPEELKEKSKLEKEVEEYIMLPLPETLSLKEMKKLKGLKGIKKVKKGIKKEKRVKKEKEIKPKIKEKRIIEKKVKKKTKKKKIKKKVRKPEKRVIKKPEINKKELKKQLLSIEKKYKALKKEGYSNEELKTIKDKINKIKHLFP